MGTQAEMFHKRLAQQIADKRKEVYADVMTHMRTWLRFTLLKSVLVSIRGVRGKQRPQHLAPTAHLEFGLIPDIASYETPL